MKRLVLPLGLLLGGLFLTGAMAPRLVDGPRLMPNVKPDMLQPDYWISRLPQPDEEICTPEGRQSLERRWQAQGLLLDLRCFPNAVSQKVLRGWLMEDYRFVGLAARFGENGQRLKPSDLRDLKQNVNLAGLAKRNPVAWGMTVRRTGMKLLPTFRIATQTPLDLEFNIFNHSEVQMAEPLAVLHTSLDREWLYVAAEVGRGWVPARDVAMTERKTIQAYQQRPSRLVLAAQVRFRQGDGRLLWESAKMGTRLALADPVADSIAFPRRDEQGRLVFTEAVAEPADGLSETPRPFTPRAVIEQAFRLLDEPYGWGSENGYGDCSEFIRSIGLACGISLPRNTSALRRALPYESLKAPGSRKSRLLSQLPGGVSLLNLPGHVMLVLGEDQGRVYVIHNFYGIHDRDSRGEYIQRVARVVVSELSLGQGSLRGSLYQRVDRALFLSPEAENRRHSI